MYLQTFFLQISVAHFGRKKLSVGFVFFLTSRRQLKFLFSLFLDIIAVVRNNVWENEAAAYGQYFVSGKLEQVVTLSSTFSYNGQTIGIWRAFT